MPERARRQGLSAETSIPASRKGEIVEHGDEPTTSPGYISEAGNRPHVEKRRSRVLAERDAHYPRDRPALQWRVRALGGGPRL